jgi:hypothetical protein
MAKPRSKEYSEHRTRHDTNLAQLYSQLMAKVKGLQGPSETQTKTTPQLELAAHLKADAINIAQALKITE